MTKTGSWHATVDKIHHDDTKCKPASDVQPTKRNPGTGNKPHCAECEKHNQEGR